MKRVVIAGLLAVLAGQTAIAQSSAISSLGLRPCSAVVSGIRDRQLVAAEYRAWVFGFLSGLNASRLHSDQKPFALTDEDAHWQWIVRRCEANPETTLFGSAVGLWNELMAGRNPALARPFFPTSK